MLQFGEAPFLECSSKGDKRFSAFYSRIRFRNNKSIEELYQGAKLFPGFVSGLSPKDAKGKRPLNPEYCRQWYQQLWREYFTENPDLLEVIRPYRGFSDIFGQTDHACQAEEVYLIWKELISGTYHG